jgi:branched-chain amino acid transport system ATP-binding protein
MTSRQRNPKDEARARAIDILKATPDSPARRAKGVAAKPRDTRSSSVSARADGRRLATAHEAPAHEAPAQEAPAQDAREARDAVRDRAASRRRRADRSASGDEGAPKDGDDRDTAPARPASEPARPRTGLTIDAIDVHYGQVQALRRISLEVAPGEVVALLGANGAGKSSTLKAIAGVVSPSAGSIVFNGQPIEGLEAHKVVRHGVALIPEGRELFPTMTVEENLRLGYWPQRGVGGRSLEEALDYVYTMFPRMGERRNQAAGTMSGGEQQMLVFGRSLMSDPQLLLADEMSLGLAPLIVQTLFDAVLAVQAEGTSVIIVEQFVHKALKHAQRAYVLAKGEIVLEAPSEQLRNDPNLLAAYLGGAEGHVEETPGKQGKRGTRKASGGSGAKSKAASGASTRRSARKKE